ncbi:MAG: tetratricopeptide repeat protein [Bryobacteraceae bacterium]
MMRGFVSLALVLGTSVGAAFAASPWKNCQAMARHGKRSEAKACFERLVRGPDSMSRAEGFWGLGQYDEAKNDFARAYKEQPQSAEARTEWGLLFLERFNPGEAANLFNEALKLDPNYAPASLGMARVAAEGYGKKAVEFAQESLRQDPKYVEAHEFLAFLALEDSNSTMAADEAQKALALSPEALDAMAVLASMDWLKAEGESQWIGKILAINPTYGEAYATGAHFLVINRRYEEGIRLYRKALELDGNLWAARSQLGINLMRLGFEEEAKTELNRSYEAHYRDAQTVNALRLLDTLGDYTTVKTPSTELMLHKKESALLRPYVESELQKAVSTYSRKYGVQLPGPVRLEVYPNHEDFVVRTLGLPGQGGLLGVTFGLVVAMDSPSARPAGGFNWASTMWHELSHVYVLTATKHFVPRWFTEGLAVHEEGVASPDWGDRMTPEIVGAIREKRLLPVLELERGFVRPSYPQQVIVSYYEAGKMCDFISKKWGDGALLGMIHSFAARKTTEEAIQENLHESPKAFDTEFMAWLNAQTANVTEHFDEWKKDMRAALSAGEDGKNPDIIIKQASSLRDWYPEFTGSGSPYELLAKAYVASGKKTEAVAQLERYREMGGTNIETLKQLAQLESEIGKKDEARKTLTKLLYIYPEDESVHGKLGQLLLESADATGAVREYQAVVDLKPADTAEAHFHLAQALLSAHRNGEAKDQVLTALEAAPGYKPAQQLLLKLSQE